MTNRIRIVCAVVASSVILRGQPLQARPIEGVSFAGRYTSSDVDLPLHCAALLRYMVFIKAYVVALYLPAQVPPSDVLKDVPKRLEIEYLHAIDGKKFGPAGETVLARNVDAAMVGQLRSRLDAIGKLYQDVKPGDRYALTYIPGKGTELALNGVRKGVIEGADFAAAYFSIWVGDKPVDVATRNGLLACAKP